MSYLKNVNANVHGDTDLGLNSFNINKTSIDKSMLQCLFTYDIPFKMWKELNWDGTDFIEQLSLTNAISTEGSLHFSGLPNNGDINELRTLEHIRYQPNRGHLYSTSIFLPSPNNDSTRRFGIILPCNGVFYELIGNGTSYTLNFVVRNHFVDTKYDITQYIPAGTDLSLGNMFDFQMQWRGVGDYKCFINKKLIFQTSEIGTRTKVSVENPSLPVGFEIETRTDVSKIICGCVDITSEGGGEIHGKPTSFETGSTLLAAENSGTAMLAIRMPYKVIYGGDSVCYSRDAILDRISTFAKDETVISVYVARGKDVTNLKSITWSQKQGSFVEFLVGGTNSTLDDAFQLDKSNMYEIYNMRQERDFSLRIENSNTLTGSFKITANDYIVVVIKPDANSSAVCGANIEISEQI